MRESRAAYPCSTHSTSAGAAMSEARAGVATPMCLSTSLVMSMSSAGGAQEVPTTATCSRSGGGRCTRGGVMRTASSRHSAGVEAGVVGRVGVAGAIVGQVDLDASAAAAASGGRGSGPGGGPRRAAGSVPLDLAGAASPGGSPGGWPRRAVTARSRVRSWASCCAARAAPRRRAQRARLWWRVQRPLERRGSVARPGASRGAPRASGATWSGAPRASIG
mmetsp:Transcript_65750/g.203574  ORF Transcript_65750/g.203574 Transcript_65750/m.203574 type:complete len:220 (-) Transcript_65750:126-785(-)